MIERIAAALGLLIIGLTAPARADVLPYTNRTHAFTGLGSTVLGGIHNVGMAGANAALGDNYEAAAQNPAGIAMSLEGIDVTFANNTLYDGNIQNVQSPIGTSSFGGAFNQYPWGFSVGYSSPYREEATYSINGTGGDSADLDVATRELQISAARIFMQDKLALGLGIDLGQAERAMNYTINAGSSTAYHSYMVGLIFGAMYQLPRRWILGAAYRTPLNYPADPNQNTPGVANFFQPVNTPSHLLASVGWVPNRVFRAGMVVESIGSTPAAALLADDSQPVGRYVTFQPQLGMDYLLAEYAELRLNTYLGTYFETSRAGGDPSRLHGTFGAEAKIWVVGLGWGIDIAPNYRNYLFSAGVDIVRVASKLGLLPKTWRPPSAGFLPSPFHLSDEGLPRPLDAHWTERDKPINPIEVVRQLPQRLGNIPSHLSGELDKAGKSLSNALGGKDLDQDVRKNDEDATKEDAAEGFPHPPEAPPKPKAGKAKGKPARHKRKPQPKPRHSPRGDSDQEFPSRPLDR